jgi:hypothetical protein
MVRSQSRHDGPARQIFALLRTGQTGGACLGKLRSAVINVNPANSTETSREGLNDTSALEKDILTVVHVSFEID